MAYVRLSDPTTAGLLGDNLIREEDININGKLIFHNKYPQRLRCVKY
jgi:hypothetical protein